jgi:hypothetical protein
MGTLDGHVDRFDPWHPLSSMWHRHSRWGRHIGMGDPLMGTSWQNRPLYGGWLFGGMFGDDLTAGQATQQNDLIGGYRLGWDFDHYWGIEARFAFSNVDFVDESDSSTRNAENTYWDVNLLYYPWGDARWRPFASLGMGWGGFSYTLSDGQAIDKTLFTLPIAGGVKYYFQRWLALRFTLTDNWAIGQGPLNTMHNVALTADVEVRFGGRRTSYSPYSGSIHMW